MIECAYAGCSEPGEIERWDRLDETKRWFCPSHDPLDDDDAKAHFRTVETVEQAIYREGMRNGG